MKKKAIISPLDWGWGHTTRCVDLIKRIEAMGYEVDIACNEQQKMFLIHYFPNRNFISLSGYNIFYSAKGMDILTVFRQIPKFFTAIIREYLFLKKYLKNQHYDLIVSDNRLGFRHRKVFSIMVSHQLQIKAPWPVRFLNVFLLNKFHEIWVPDDEHNSFAGDLSKVPSALEKKTKYIGYLSRLNHKNVRLSGEPMYDFMAICSGPEPQKTIFFEYVVNQLKNTDLKGCVLQGKINVKIHKQLQNIEIFSHLNDDEFLLKITQSKIIICQSGYSTLMDIIPLKKKMILIPTPFQSEQEYLAKYHSENNNRIIRLSQDEQKLYSAVKTLLNR